jgi:hypothetical protein
MILDTHMSTGEVFYYFTIIKQDFFVPTLAGLQPHKYMTSFLILSLSFRRVANVVNFLLGKTPASVCC